MRRAVAVTMIAVALGATLGGLWLVGGPWEARKQQADRARLEDLRGLARTLYCREGTAPDALPEDGAPYCEGVFDLGDRVDPVTGAAYRYARIDDLRFSLCGDFHDPEGVFWRDTDAYSFDRATGCVTASVRSR